MVRVRVLTEVIPLVVPSLFGRRAILHHNRAEDVSQVVLEELSRITSIDPWPWPRDRQRQLTLNEALATIPNAASTPKNDSSSPIPS